MEARRIRVLHVDDDADARLLMSTVLGMEPDLEEVGSCHDATDLLRAVERTTPDVLVIDLTMPGKDPLEAIAEVHAALPAVRIVALSGQSDPRVLERARTAGASTLLLKGEDLFATLDAIRGPRA